MKKPVLHVWMYMNYLLRFCLSADGKLEDFIAEIWAGLTYLDSYFSSCYLGLIMSHSQRCKVNLESLAWTAKRGFDLVASLLTVKSCVRNFIILSKQSNIAWPSIWLGGSSTYLTRRKWKELSSLRPIWRTIAHGIELFESLSSDRRAFLVILPRPQTVWHIDWRVRRAELSHHLSTDSTRRTSGFPICKEGFRKGCALDFFWSGLLFYFH